MNRQERRAEAKVRVPRMFEGRKLNSKVILAAREQYARGLKDQQEEDEQDE